MAIARVQSVGSGATTGAALTIAKSITVTAGNGLIVILGENVASVGTVSGVSDGGVNTYIHATGAIHTEGTTTIGDLFYVKSLATSATITVTATFTVSGGGLMTLIEVSGQDKTTFFDKIAGAVGSSTAPNSGARPRLARLANSWSAGSSPRTPMR